MKLPIARNNAANISGYESPANCLLPVLFAYPGLEISAVLIGHAAPMARCIPHNEAWCSPSQAPTGSTSLINEKLQQNQPYSANIHDSEFKNHFL